MCHDLALTVGRTASPPVTGKDRLHVRRKVSGKLSYGETHGGQGHGRGPRAREGDLLRVLLGPGRLKVLEATRVHMLQRGVFGPLMHTRYAPWPGAHRRRRMHGAREVSRRVITGDEARALRVEQETATAARVAECLRGRRRGRGQGGGGRVVDDSDKDGDNDGDGADDDEGDNHHDDDIGMSSESSSEEPYRVNDAKLSKVQGKRSKQPLFLGEWEGWPDEIGRTWEPYEHFGDHAALADNFIEWWKDADKPEPPQ